LKRAYHTTSPKNPFSQNLEDQLEPYVPLVKKLLRRYSTTVKPTIDPNTHVVLPDDVAKWSVDQVKTWAQDQLNKAGRSPDSVKKSLEILTNNDVTGSTLLNLTEEKLMKLYGMLGGPANTLSSAIDNLKGKNKHLFFLSF